MTAFWAERTLRERALIAALAAMCAAYLMFIALWQPLQRHRTTLTGDIAQQSRLISALTVLPTGAVTAPLLAPDTPLPTIITDTATAFQLTIRRLQPTQDAAEITLEDAPFDTVLVWIDALERDHGLRIIALSMTRRPEPGLVAATLTIGR